MVLFADPVVLVKRRSGSWLSRARHHRFDFVSLKHSAAATCRIEPIVASFRQYKFVNLRVFWAARGALKAARIVFHSEFRAPSSALSDRAATGIERGVRSAERGMKNDH